MKFKRIWIQTVFAIKLFIRCPELLLTLLPVKRKKASLWDRA